MKSQNPFRRLSTKTVYENPWMRVREDAVIRPDGREGIYGVVEAEDAVLVTAVNDRSEVYVIRLFSYPASAWSWALPGGNCDGEDLAQAAARELEEEAGITALEWIPLGKIRTAGGMISHQYAFFLARNLTLGVRVDADDRDLIGSGKFVSFNEIDTMIQSGDIDDSLTITGIHLVQQWLGRNAIEASSISNM